MLVRTRWAAALAGTRPSAGRLGAREDAAAVFMTREDAVGGADTRPSGRQAARVTDGFVMFGLRLTATRAQRQAGRGRHAK